jgi:hypothetical protein
MGHRVFLAGLRPRLHAGERCTCARHAVRATGLGDDGEYRSRAAAYYPLEMKRSLLEEGILSIHASAQCGDRIAARDGQLELDENMLVPVTKRAARALDAWIAALSARSGSSMLGAVFHSRPPAGLVLHRIHSDAAIKGTGDPGITTNLYGHYATMPLNGTRYARLYRTEKFSLIGL